MKKAFTLFEMMMVLGIMSILSGIGFVYFKHRREYSFAVNIVEFVKIYEMAVRMYWTYNRGEFPADIKDKTEMATATSLKDYLPSNFTKNIIRAKACENILWINNGEKNEKIGISILLNSESLRTSVYEQLNDNCLEEQLIFPNLSDGADKFELQYILKDGETIYF